MQDMNQVRWITDRLLEGYFIDIKVSEIMKRQRELQRNIKATQKLIKKEERRFEKLKQPKLKHETGVLLSRLRAQLITDQAMLTGMVCAKESIDEYRAIPF